MEFPLKFRPHILFILIGMTNMTHSLNNMDRFSGGWKVLYSIPLSQYGLSYFPIRRGNVLTCIFGMLTELRNKHWI